jgi:hypothetical protein
MSSHATLLVAALSVSLCSHSALCQDAPAATAAPAPAAAEPVLLTATVQEVTGIAQVRLTPDSPWQKATVGMTLPEGAEIRTGPKSSIRCLIGTDQAFVLDRLGTIKITEAIQQENKVRTELSMKYGRTQYAIESAGLEHESTISSPGSTLAVRGTIVALYNQPPYTPTATSFTGRANFKSGRVNTTLGSKGSPKASMSADSNSAATAALTATVLDPRVSIARTPSETVLIAAETSRGAALGFDESSGIRVLRGGSPIDREADLLPTLPSGLSFVARWTTNTDVNLQVFLDSGDPNLTFIESGGAFVADEFVFPGFGLQRSQSGFTAFDHRGGPNGGTEIVNFPSAPLGVYGLGVVYVSGDPANVVVNAFLNGTKISLFDFVTTPDTPKTTTIRATIGPAEFLAPLAFNPPLTILEDIFTDAANGAPADLTVSPSTPPTAEQNVITTASFNKASAKPAATKRILPTARFGTPNTVTTASVPNSSVRQSLAITPTDTTRRNISPLLRPTEQLRNTTTPIFNSPKPR